MLKSIEAQHGLLVERARRIYSFSHLTFQEYFTAKAIINSFDSQTLEKSVSHVTNKSWREVFLLASGMMPRADKLLQLMKQQVDDLVAKNDKLQQFLIWLDQKSSLFQASHKPAAIRALYLALDLALKLALVLAPEPVLPLQKLKAQLPNPDTEATRLKKWRQAHSRVWIEKLKAVITQHPSIGHYRRFSKSRRNY